MRELDTLTESEIESLTYVLTDVDDTITMNEKLHVAGLKAVCVIGGSVG